MWFHEVLLLCPMLTVSEEVKPPWIVQMIFKYLLARLRRDWNQVCFAAFCDEGAYLHGNLSWLAHRNFSMNETHTHICIVIIYIYVCKLRSIYAHIMGILCITVLAVLQIIGLMGLSDHSNIEVSNVASDTIKRPRGSATFGVKLMWFRSDWQ